MSQNAQASTLPASNAGAGGNRAANGNALRSEEASQRGSESQSCVESLSQRLRCETAVLHQEIERRLDLPASITSIDRYLTCLALFYRLYRPLEAGLKNFNQWSKIGISLNDRLQAPRLARDLSVLGVAPVLMLDAPADALPDMPTFAHAAGVLYVMEGSTLGSPFILRHLQRSLGGQLAGATAFFGAHGASTGERWKSFTQSVDAYGSSRLNAKVVDGAVAAFHAIGEWIGHGIER